VQVVDTATGQCAEGETQLKAGEELPVEGRALVLLRRLS
jgi:hypothetical protein